MVNDLQGRVLLRRPSWDMDAEDAPAVFVVRRNGGGTSTYPAPGANSTLSDITVIFDVIGVVRASARSTLAGEELLADLQRALEIEADPFLFDPTLVRNLLSQEMRLVSIELDPPEDGVPFDLVGVGVSCTYPHHYGDPNHVA